MPLVAIVGATGTGKSDAAVKLALQLARRGIASEIVNADAMQLYRGMDIGTAKLSESEREGVPHHLIDVLAVTEESTAAEYQKLAREKILEIHSRSAVPILVGGSMLYVAAVLNRFEFPQRDASLRAELEADLERLGPVAMHRRLAEIDDTAAARIIPQNGRRIVRAIEIVLLTGKPFAAALPEAPESWQPHLQIGLRMDRSVLVERLAGRVRLMWERGLLEEVRGLLAKNFRASKTASVAIGYAQALAQLDGELTESDAISETIRLTQRYARRQVSWFKRDDRINWFDALAPDLSSQILSATNSHLSEFRP